MIVVMDKKNQTIILYTKDGINKIPFNEANSISEFIGNEKVTYVTKAIKVTAMDIIGVVNSLGIKTKPPLPVSNNKYLHGTLDGTIYVKSDLKFEGKYDCKLIDSDMKKIIQETPLLQTLINKNKIEIIGETSRIRLLKEFKEDQKKQLEMQKKQDTKLDSIIMDEKISDWDGNVKSGMEDEAIVIDLTNDVKAGNQPGMEDLIREIDGE